MAQDEISNRYRMLLDVMDDGVVVHDASGTIIEFNPASLQILGLTQEQLLGKSSLDPQWKTVGFDGRPISGNEHPAIQALCHGRPIKNFIMGVRFFGATKWLSINAKPFDSTTTKSDHPIPGVPPSRQVIVTFSDVTEMTNIKNRHQQILDALNDTAIISLTNPQGVITAANKNFCMISGYREDELLGQDHRILNSGTHSKEFFASLWKSLSQGKTWNADIQNRRKNGETYWVRSIILPLYDAEHQISEYLSICFDITKQKFSEIQHEMMSKMLQDAQNIAKIGSFSYDIKTSQLSWTTEHYKIFEISEPQPQSELFRLYASRIHPDDLAQLNKVMEGAQKHGKDFVYDHRLILPDGSIRYVQGIGHVSKNEQGIPIRITGTCQDITERVHKEEKLTFILDALGIGVWQLKPQSMEFEIDHRMCQLYDIDIDRKENFYHQWMQKLDQETSSAVKKEFQQALGGEKEFSLVFELKSEHGAPKYISSQAKVVRDSLGQPSDMIGIAQDITEEIIAKKSLDIEKAMTLRNAKLASLGEMSAGIAHEINNPLSIISGIVQVLPKYLDTPDQLKLRLDSCRKGIDRIAKIVKSLKKFARTSEKVEYMPQSLSSIIQESLTLTESHAKRHSTLVTGISQSTSVVLGDEIELEQVFVNLINNAVDAVAHLDERWVKIESWDEEDCIICRISDSGKGIPENVQKKLFQPFFTTKQVGKGTGLGLSIVRGILAEHGASIELVNGKGHTCFELRFPQIKANKNAA